MSQPDATAQPPKRYTSEVRDEQARRTQRAIVTAARDLFLARGYAATTIDGIAEAAHVSRRTVFNSVGGKAALLKLAFDWAIVGDDEPVALADRPAVKAIVAEPDPRQALLLWVQTSTEIATRTAPLGEVLTAAADIDPAAAKQLAEWSRNRMAGAAGFIRYLASLDGLAAGLHRATCRGALLGAHRRPPLPAAGRSARLEHRRLQPVAVQQPRGGMCVSESMAPRWCRWR